MKHNEILLERTDYYRIICVLSKVDQDDRWLGQIRVMRDDTSEFINKGFTVLKSTKDAVLAAAKKRIGDSLIQELREIGKPTDWNSRVRFLLMQCKELRQYIMEFGIKSVDTLTSKGEGNDYFVDYSIFWKTLIKKSISFSKAIDSLSTDERLDLLSFPSDALKDPADAWSLEELDLRIMSFEFFSCPTEREKQLYNVQKKMLADRFVELGME